MIVVIHKTGKASTYASADTVKTEQTEYLIYAKDKIVAQVPRENVEQIEYHHPPINS